MKISPIIAAVIVTLLAACLLSVAWRLFDSGVSSSVPGIAIWVISIYVGIWEYRLKRRRQK